MAPSIRYPMHSGLRCLVASEHFTSHNTFFAVVRKILTILEHRDFPEHLEPFGHLGHPSVPLSDEPSPLRALKHPGLRM